MYKFLSSLIILFLFSLSSSSLFAQGRSSSPGEQIEKNQEYYIQKLSINDKVLDDLFLDFKKNAMVLGSAESLIMTNLNIESYLRTFESNIAKPSIEMYENAKMNVFDKVDDAKEKLKKINYSKNITLINSDSFFGDKDKLSKIISFKVDVLTKDEEMLFYEVIFVEVDGEFKIIAINQ